MIGCHIEVFFDTLVGSNAVGGGLAVVIYTGLGQGGNISRARPGGVTNLSRVKRGRRGLGSGNIYRARSGG